MIDNGSVHTRLMLYTNTRPCVWAACRLQLFPVTTLFSEYPSHRCQTGCFSHVPSPHNHPRWVRLVEGTVSARAPVTCLLFPSISANKLQEGLVCAPLRRKPLVGLPGVGCSCPAGHHPAIHGSADHGCDCQQEGAQAEGRGGGGPI